MEGETPHPLVPVILLQTSEFVSDLTGINILRVLVPVPPHFVIKLVGGTVAALSGLFVPLTQVEKDLTQFVCLLANIPLCHF